jgi:hypothetical protein
LNVPSSTDITEQLHRPKQSEILLASEIIAELM